MCKFQSRLDPGYIRFKYSLETTRSVAVDIDDSEHITPVALPQSNLERRMVLAIRGMVYTISAPIPNFSVVYNVIIALVHDDKETSQDDNTLMSLSVIRQFAPTGEFHLNMTTVGIAPNFN